LVVGGHCKSIGKKRLSRCNLVAFKKGKKVEKNAAAYATERLIFYFYFFETQNPRLMMARVRYVVPTQHKKRIKLNANPLMQYARIDTALKPLHTCFFVPLFFTHVFSSVLMFQI
jgi:hypothetical protein